MSVIAYDKPVQNLISQLSATGHVTHSTYKKTSVTLHHNAAVNLSHESILGIWKTRPASAHFDVDKSGAVAQFVNVGEYAWAVGSTSGNESSISIEMANSKGAPTWEVADATWKAAARLAGWLFFHEVGARPTSSNFFVHHHWSSTACAGPYIDKIWSQVLAAAQSAYDSFKGGKAPSGGSSAPTSGGKESIAQVAKDVEAGKYGNDPGRTSKLKAEGYDPAAVQAQVNKDLGGKSAPAKPSAPPKQTVEQVARDVMAGKYGDGVARVTALTKAGYNSDTVQKEVNYLMGGAKPSAPAKKSNSEIANEIIAGTGGWGTDPGRAQKLKAAGYDAAAIQSLVNARI